MLFYRQSGYKKQVADPHPPRDASVMLQRMAALCEPARRDLYLFVAERGGWVSRDDAAAAVGLRRGLVAHHLDRLADDGLLEVSYRRLTGRSGPGAGRPAKLYRRADVDLELTIPPRNPNLVGALLAEAISGAGAAGDAVRENLLGVARDAGVAVGRGARRGRSARERRAALIALLEEYGYVPVAAGGELSLRSCPYEPLSRRDRELVCSMNLALVDGAAAGVGVRGATFALRPPSDRGCCVHVAPWPSETDG